MRSYSVDERITSAFLYQPGTVWYYVDSASRESVQIRIDLVTHGRSTYEGDAEFLDLEQYFSAGVLLHPAASGLDTASIQFELDRNAMLVGYRNPKAGDRYFKQYLFENPMPKKATSLGGRGVYDYFPALTVRGKTYSEVYYSRPDSDEFWLTENEGIIKMHLRHPDENGLDRVYELDSCRILR